MDYIDAVLSVGVAAGVRVRSCRLESPRPICTRQSPSRGCGSGDGHPAALVIRHRGTASGSVANRRCADNTARPGGSSRLCAGCDYSLAAEVALGVERLSLPVLVVRLFQRGLALGFAEFSPVVRTCLHPKSATEGVVAEL